MAHATVEDLDNYLQDNAPADAERLLERATTTIDATVTAAYDPDSVVVAAVLRDAVCAQVEWWIATGDEVEATARYENPGVGTLNVKTTGVRIAPRAIDILQAGGLLQGVWF